jgi:hypothetical protein
MLSPLGNRANFNSNKKNPDENVWDFSKPSAELPFLLLSKKV